MKPIKPKGRAVPVYVPGAVNRAGEYTLPAHDITFNGRTLRYMGRREIHVDGHTIATAVWREDGDGLQCIGSLDPLPHRGITKKGYLHLSITRHDRYPGWDEMVALVEAIAGTDVDMAMIKPRRSDYVAMHQYCFHWWELPVEWGVR